MGEHYPKSTESVTAYCLKCRAFTEHRVDQGRKGPCLACIEQAAKKVPAHPQAKAKEPKPENKTGDLF